MKIIFEQKSINRKFRPSCRFSHGTAHLLNEEIPMCIACDCPLTIKHILVECADTVLTRQEYFNCHDLKTLFNSVAGDTILAYLSEINLIGSI